jgi:hypothetical protein
MWAGGCRLDNADASTNTGNNKATARVALFITLQRAD